MSGKDFPKSGLQSMVLFYVSRKICAVGEKVIGDTKIDDNFLNR